MLKQDHLPFNALRAFEVAARTGSFVNAGRALAVSAAAISQQVKTLEELLGRQLFLRQGNRITLTDAGRTLYPSIQSAMTELQTATRNVQAAPAGRARLLLSVMPSLAELWLMPALAGFEGCSQLDIRVEDDPVDLARGGIDLRLTYSAHYYPDHLVSTLFTDRLIAVAAPNSRFPADLEQLSDTALIHTDWGRDYGVQPDWRLHFEALGSPRHPDLTAGLRVGSTSLAMAAARAGLGVALVPKRLAVTAIGCGLLQHIGHHGAPLPRDYVMITTNGHARHRRLQALKAYLLQVAAIPMPQ